MRLSLYRAPRKQLMWIQPGACPVERRRKIETVLRWKQEGHERRKPERGSAVAVPGQETSLPAGGGGGMGTGLEFSPCGPVVFS